MAINFPFGDIATASISADASNDAITISTNATLITTASLTSSATLDLTIDDEVEAGAFLHIKCTTNGSETFAFGTGIDAPTVTGSAGKTWCQGFIYNGTAFYPMGAKIQID
jgi:hypothetical protein